jgi:hypothetical protein
MTAPLPTTAPLTPPGCDLRDFGFMPLDIVRLFGSEFHAMATDSEWRAGVTLWLKSFHQVPAGSLPDDDVALARLAEFGRDLRSWKKVKAGALRGWRLCSDGRLYHPVVAEKVNDAWARKLSMRERGRKGNEKRWDKLRPESEQASGGRAARSGTDHMEDDPSLGQKIASQNNAGALARGSLNDPCGIARGSQGTGTGTKKEKEDDAALRADRRPISLSGEPYAFEAGVIRLVSKDLEAWRRDFPNLSLEAELRSLAEWAGRENPKGWFHAVQAALAKRNREQGLAVERVKAEATALAHAPPALRPKPSAYVP